ncbi:MAG: hypothetical protein ACREAY_10175 [Nitrososphaera sp.]|uniref:hypothetical protein n=1 Tax=Nitrososphaera sp. TaxID=1971748 RepID=UPI003D6F3A77
MHATTLGVVIAAMLVLSIASMAVAAQPSFAQTETKGDSWNSINTTLGDVEKTFAADKVGALTKLDSAKSKYDSVFKQAAADRDGATAQLVDTAFADMRAAVENNSTKIVVVHNKQIIDKTIYKIAFMNIEHSLDEAQSSSFLRDSMVAEAGEWYTVMTKKFKYDQTPSESSQAMAALQADPGKIGELSPAIIDGLKAQFLLKVKEEITEAIGALEKTPADTASAQKFAIEGISYYRTIQPDAKAKLGEESEAELFHELEEHLEASAAGDLAAAQHAADEANALLVTYEGGEATGIGAAIGRMTDMLHLVDEEYGAAVANGQIIDQQEYDEAILFLERANEAFAEGKTAMLAVAQHETEEVEAGLATLATLIEDKADPAEVKATVEQTLHELEEIQAAAGNSAEFVANIEFIRGHLEKAIENKNAGNIELAIAHSGHPVDEIYSLVEGDISSKDDALNTELKGALTALANQANTASAAEFEDSVNAILPMLDGAVEAVAGDEASDPALWAQAIVLLLETANLEYSEAVEGGEIVEMIEYQDATAFIHRAEVAFEAIKADMPEHEAEEVEEFFAELNSLTASNASPDKIATIIGGINHEFAEVFGLEEAEQELDGWGYIDRIRELLDESLEQYEAGNTQEARALAVEAYLDNYEFIEADIAVEDKGLMEQIEVDMRIELVKMIDEGKPASEVAAHVEQIKEDLETARAVVTPEFPVAAIVASLGIAGTIAYGRLRGSGKRA